MKRNRLFIALSALLVAGLAACTPTDIPVNPNPSTSTSDATTSQHTETPKPDTTDDTPVTSETPATSETPVTSETPATSEDKGDDLPTLPADLPTEEGSTTYAFELASYSVKMPTFASAYITGGTFGWATGADALELKQFNDTNIYYAIGTLYDESANQGNEYQLVMGYNASSGETNIGLDWTNGIKSNECAAIAYPGNAKFTAENNAKVVNLGIHSWSNALAEPNVPTEPVTAINVTVTLTDTGSTGFAEGFVPTIAGAGDSLNNWGTHNPMELVDGIWTFTIANVLDKAEFLITAGNWDSKISDEGDKNIIVKNETNKDLIVNIAFDFALLGNGNNVGTITVK